MRRVARPRRSSARARPMTLTRYCVAPPPGISPNAGSICPKMAFLTAPMVPAGTKAKVTRHERDDYVGRDIVRLDGDGRPVMSITTEREEGQDVVVFAPTATGFGRSD